MTLAHRLAAVLGGVFLNLAFGGLYAYSAMVPALELSGALSRTDTAMVFALSTTSFMAGVWACSHCIRRWSHSTVAVVSGVGAAAGLLLCSAWPGLTILVLGYSGIYGLCAGMGYALSLAGLAGVTLKRPGLAAGVVVCAFAAGSVCWAQGFARAISAVGIPATLTYSAFVVLLLACVAALAFWFAHSPGAREQVAGEGGSTELANEAGGSRLSAASLWLIFFALAGAGLTVIGQALQLLGSQEHFAIFGLSVVALAGAANGLGRLAGGAMADRSAPVVLLGLPLLLTVLGLALLAVRWNAAASYLAILLIAFMYGWSSAAIPAVVMSGFGKVQFSAVYGRVFTAWGAAGLIAPWASGWVYAQQGSYGMALLAIGVICVFAFGFLFYQIGGRNRPRSSNGASLGELASRPSDP